MDQEKLIQVSFQIPPSALDSLSKLAEQLRLLTEVAGVPAVSKGSTADAEHVESGSFDPERFLALQQGQDRTNQGDEARGAGPAAVSDIEEAKAAAAAISPAEGSEAVSAEVRGELRDAEGAGDAVNLLSRPDAPDSPQDTSGEDTLPDAPGASPDAGQQVPDAESAQAEAEERELLPAAARREISGGVEAPLGAGMVVQTQLETPQSRWSGVTEELVVPGPAPLTAEAVSLAFERDGRRYDNGFPLY
ncbi:MAG: hypothetical protein K2N78_00100 [Oscillospiraceae bacterium]|nr:hypothetical protein [Oscillospiraceae bacterium]